MALWAARTGLRARATRAGGQARRTTMLVPATSGSWVARTLSAGPITTLAVAATAPAAAASGPTTAGISRVRTAGASPHALAMATTPTTTMAVAGATRWRTTRRPSPSGNDAHRSG